MKNLLIAGLLLAASGAATGADAFTACTADAATCMASLGNLGLPLTSLMTDCTSQPATLSASVTAANYNQTKVDAAWNTFCAATCGTALPLATTDLYCCFTLLSKMNELVGLKSACARSTTNPSRYCGAELNALTALSCPATNSADCGAMPNCQWYGAFNKCLYNPASAAALDAVCTPCNRNLFKQFATGGMTGLTQYSTIAAAFDFACRKVEDQYCLLVAKDMGYRAVGELQPSDVTSMCSGASSVAKRCYRSMTASAARAIVRSARASFEVCGGADECQTTLVQSLTLATALEKAAATMCSVDATGTNCLLKVAGTNAQMPCLGKVGISGNCTDCDTEASAAAAATGCCGPVIATSGALIATAAPTGRLLFSNIAQGGAANVNFMASTPPALDSTNLNLFLGLARTQASANLFAGVQACPTFYSSYSEWVSASNIATCTVRPNSRTYDFVIAASYAAYNSCSNKSVVADSLNADLSIAIGITRAQIMSSAITDNGDNSLRVRVRFSDDSSSMITAIDAAIKASSFTVYFLTAGRDMVYNCPAMIPDGTVANMLVSATPVANEGDEPVPTTTTTTRTTTTMTTTTTVAAPGGVASLSTVAAATIAALVGAVMLF